MEKKKNSHRASEQEAVYTTIVGGRPPGSGTSLGTIPRGIEVLVKKASVDSGFKTTLLKERAGSARKIGLDLDPTEAAMLNVIPGEQLEAIISKTTVRPESRRAFLGKVASLMLAALGVSVLGCSSKPTEPDSPRTPAIEEGIRPDRPPRGIEAPRRLPYKDGPQPAGIRPDNPSVGEGSQLDQSPRDGS